MRRDKNKSRNLRRQWQKTQHTLPALGRPSQIPSRLVWGYNNTKKRLELIGTYMDCGKIVQTPDAVEPGESNAGYVTAKFGAYGVKGALIYQWGNNDKEKVVIFLENPVRGRNKSGIKYYWDTSKSNHWYYCIVPTVKSGETMESTINKWFTIKSYVSGGNSAGAAFTLET